jgi:hypothetical protein
MTTSVISDTNDVTSPLHRVHAYANDNNGHKSHRNHLDELIAREQAAGFRVAAEDFKSVEGSIKDSRYDVVSVVEKTGTAAALAACKTQDAVGESTDKVLSSVRHGIEKGSDEFSFIQKQLSDAATATVVGFKDSAALAYQVEGRALLEAAKNFNALGVQADKNWYQTNIQAQTNASAAILLATQNQAAALAFAAECCCETKELITAEGVKTRDLIQANELVNANRRTQKAEAALAAYFAGKVVPTIPII